MLTDKEEKFIEDWQKHREQEHKNSFWQAIKTSPKFLRISIIIPFIYLLYYKFDQGWFQIHKNENTLHQNPYFDNPMVIFSILLGSILIAIFVSYFTKQFNNEQNEQYYKELISKKNKQ